MKIEKKCQCGKKFYLTPGQIRPGHGKYCSRICYYKYRKVYKIAGWNKDKKMSEDWKNNLSLSRIKNGVAVGEKNPNWKGGLTKYSIALKNKHEYKEWRKAVYERDSYACQICGVNGNGKNLEAHHIIPLSVLIKKQKNLYDIKNGQTLCGDCHKKTDTYGWRVWNYYLRPTKEVG